MSGYLTDFFTFLFFNVSCALKKGPKIPKKLSKKKTLQKDDQDKDDYITFLSILSCYGTRVG